MNKLYSVGPLYWIMRDNGKKSDKIIGWGFMRQTSAPWRTGRGPHVRVGKYSLQFGLSKKAKIDNEEDGLLYAITGRLMDTKPVDIGDW